MGENHFAALPAAVYGGVLLLSGLAYKILQAAIMARQGPDSKLAVAVGRNGKSKLSVVLYTLAIPLAFFRPWVAHVI